MISLTNISKLQKEVSLISKSRLRGNNTRPRYRLNNKLKIQLSNGINITIPKSFEWDQASVPRFLWTFLAPDGDFEIAYLIHDYLWINKEAMAELFSYYEMPFNRKFTDQEMLRWAKVTNGTKKPSLRNLDNYIRYIGVRAFGWLVWTGLIKLK